MLFRAITTSIFILLLTELAAGQTDTVRVETDLVYFPVNVSNREGKFIIGLNESDFTIFENGEKQEIAFFRAVNEPVTLMLLLDRSGSMVPHYKRVAEAANEFIRQLRPDDKILVATFANTTDLVAGPVAVSELRKNINIVAHRDDNITLLYDGVDFGLNKLKKAAGRKVMVLFSDGVGSGIFASENENLKYAEESGVAVYTIRFPPVFAAKTTKNTEIYDTVEKKSFHFMQELANRSGGRSFQIENIPDLATAFTKIALEVSGQYTLGYYPIKPGKDGERRQIRVTVDVPNAAVRSRREVVFKKK